MFVKLGFQIPFNLINNQKEIQADLFLHLNGGRVHLDLGFKAKQTDGNAGDSSSYSFLMCVQFSLEFLSKK